MARIQRDRITRFRPQTNNANRHTQRGLRELDASMRQDGYIAPMTAAADGEIIDGSARLERAADLFGDDILVVEHDGTRPVVMVRTDIPNAQSDIARRVSIRANRVAQLDLSWDLDVLKQSIEQLDLTGLFDGKEIRLDDQQKSNDDIIKSQFLVLIECENEAEQTALLNRFIEDGLKCKALIS